MKTKTSKHEFEILEYIDSVPVISVTNSRNINYRPMYKFHCPYCKAFHYHFELEEKIKSHCYKRIKSPLKEYILRIDKEREKDGKKGRTE